MNTQKERIYYWDNLRALLIFLVVLGHYLLPVRYEISTPFKSIYLFIYLFHMPAFVLVSGYFSRVFVARQNSQNTAAPQTILGYLIIYVLFTCALDLTQYVLSGKWYCSLWYSDGAPWYMISMVFWLLSLSFFQYVKKEIAIPATMILALLFSLNPNTGTFLSSTRTIVFLPFFLIGYHFDFEAFKKRITWKNRLIAVSVLVLIFLLVYRFNAEIMQCSVIIYAAHPYSKLPAGLADIGIWIRAVWYLLALLIILCVMLLIPQKKLVITTIGSRTLGIYIFHRLSRNYLIHLGMYKIFDKSYHIFLLTVVVSIILCLLFSAKWIEKILRYPFKIKCIFAKK